MSSNNESPLSKLPRPSESKTFLLPVYSRTLTIEEREQFFTLARKGIYSPLQLGEAFGLSRALSFTLFSWAINPRKNAEYMRRMREQRSQREASGSSK